MLKKCLIIDHNDSFTYNVKQWLLPVFSDVQIINYDNLSSVKDFNDFQLVVISPGPGCPEDYPQTLDIILRIKGTVPIFGICLGMQMIATLEGHQVTRMEAPLHGKTTILCKTKASRLLDKIEGNITIAHYHSLCIKNSSWDSICTTDRNFQYVLSIENLEQKYMGVQFHPESFLTSDSDIILKNLERWCYG